MCYVHVYLLDENVVKFIFSFDKHIIVIVGLDDDGGGGADGKFYISRDCCVICLSIEVRKWIDVNAHQTSTFS